MKTPALPVVGLTLFFSITSCGEGAPDTFQAQALEQPAETTHTDKVKRGEYLVTIAGCHDCHSPKVMSDIGPAPDPSRLLSGHPADEQLPALTDPAMTAPGQWALFSPGLTAAVGPWGTSFAANLTPDDTGIGSWSLEQFKKSIREGKSKGLDGTRPLLPPMPWPGIAQMTDEDLEAVFTYLMSLPPIRNAVPNPIPPAAPPAG